MFIGSKKHYEKLTDELEQLKNSHATTYRSMITYHHYFDNFNQTELAKNMNKTIKGCMKFSDNIIISLLGDNFFFQTSADMVNKSFEDNKKRIFEGIELEKHYKSTYIASGNNNESKIHIVPANGRVYPFGRFKKLLKERNAENEYNEVFKKWYREKSLCPDIGEWPGAILEHNGDINLCGSFEAINCSTAVVSNAFDRSYEQLESDLLDVYHREQKWLIDNYNTLKEGKAYACKIRNNCYRI